MITPSDTPSDPELYAAVPDSGMNIQAPQDQAAIAAAAAEANAVADGPRQAAAKSLQESPAGYGDFGITAGFSGSDGETWPADVRPRG
jgi:hypothetical protein